MIRSYIIGFLTSLVLTAASFGLVTLYVSSKLINIPYGILLTIILCLAVIQLIVQLIFFLHLGTQKGQQWNGAFLMSTVMVIFIIIVGSIWIMTHLNYNMSPDSMNNILIQDEGFTPNK